MASRNLALPAPTTMPSMMPHTPFDSTRVKFVTRGSEDKPEPPANSAAQPTCILTMLLASGCGSRDSRAAKRRKSSSLPWSPAVGSTATSRTSKWPSVRVPVLSTPSASSCARHSSVLDRFTRTCRSLSSLTKMHACTIGAAATKAQGQAPAKAARPRVGSPSASASARAPTQTRGVYQAARRSTSSSVREREFRASSTASCILPWKDSPADAVQVISPPPLATTVPESTEAPTAFSCGRASPVTDASSTLRLSLLRTLPSTGTASPLRRSTASPGLSSSIRTSSMAPEGARRVACVAPLERLRWSEASTAAFTRPTSHSDPLTTSATVAASRSWPMQRAPTRTMNMRTWTLKRRASSDCTARFGSACPSSKAMMKSAAATERDSASDSAMSPPRNTAHCSSSTTRDTGLSASSSAASMPRTLRGQAGGAATVPPTAKILAPSILEFNALQS
mmetsp:Transcript_63085/g.184445  ORF Transcript_63085/g.184445 Transcript_63085/m.184445 type:complete len:452 (-) Transcript_63085:397-1752(-)